MGKIRWLHISDLHYDREMTGDWPVLILLFLREICILTEEITTKESAF